SEEQRQTSDETQCQCAGKQGWCRAEVMDADIHPADPGAEQAEAIAPASTRCLFGRSFAQSQIQQPDRNQSQRPNIKGRQGKSGQGAGGQRQQIARPAGAGDPVHRDSYGRKKALEVGLLRETHLSFRRTVAVVDVRSDIHPRYSTACQRLSAKRVIRSICTRRLSALSTRKRKRSISTTSLRFGRWPKAFMTRPPTVSNSSSGNSL